MRRKQILIMKTGRQHKPRLDETLVQWWKRFDKTIAYEYTNRWGIRITQCYYADHHYWFLDALAAEGFCTLLPLPADIFGYMYGGDMTVEHWLRIHEVDPSTTVLRDNVLYLQDDSLHAILKLKLET